MGFRQVKQGCNWDNPTYDMVHITPMIILLARLHEPLSRGFRRGKKYQLGDLVSTIPPTQGSFTESVSCRELKIKMGFGDMLLSHYIIYEGP